MNFAISRMAQSLTGRFEDDSVGNKFDNLLEELKSNNPDVVKNTVCMLNTEFWMASESIKCNIKPRRFVNPLLKILGNQPDPSLMILASNCLFSLIDLAPETCDIIVDEKGLKILEEKGKLIEYIDVAEDWVKLLNKIAENCPSEVLKSGCAINFLKIIEFFNRPSQDTIMDLVK